TFTKIANFIRPILEGIQTGVNAVKSVSSAFSSPAPDNGAGGPQLHGRMAGFRGVGAANFRPALASGRMDTSRTPKVEITGAPARVTGATTADPRQKIQTDSGTVMRP